MVATTEANRRSRGGNAVFFDEKDLGQEVEGLHSVLIVPCRFCPAASAAVRSEEPYIQLTRHFLKTNAYERLIAKTKSDLESQGIRTDVFQSHLVHQFVLCMWTARQREQLADVRRAMTQLWSLAAKPRWIRSAPGSISSACQVIQGVKTEGLMSIQPRFSLSGTVQLELQGISPTTFPEQRA